MEFVMPVLEGAWRYVLTLRISDYLDIALMAYAIYWLLKLVGTVSYTHLTLPTIRLV